MNIQKNIDYSVMFTAMDAAVDAGLPQMKLYCELGRLICERSEKGAAVAAAEHLHSRFPDVYGFSPRNLRRMREFYRLYVGNAELLALAMKIAWTQNVVILEAKLEIEERRWYLRAAGQFGWSKAELQRKIDSNAYLEIQLDELENQCYTELNCNSYDQGTFPLSRQDFKNVRTAITQAFSALQVRFYRRFVNIFEEIDLQLSDLVGRRNFSEILPGRLLLNCPRYHSVYRKAMRRAKLVL